MAGLQRPFEPKPEAIEDHMPGAHTTLNLLPGGRFPARTRKTQWDRPHPRARRRCGSDPGWAPAFVPGEQGRRSLVLLFQGSARLHTHGHPQCLAHSLLM
jgi:hypothetical protein